MTDNTHQLDDYIESRAENEIGELYDKAKSLDKKKALLEIEATGQFIGASDQQVEKVMRDAITNQGAQTIDTLRKKLVCNHYGLPESALKSKLSAKQFMKLIGRLQWAGLDEKEVDKIMQDPLTYDRIRLRGQTPEQAIDQLFVENFGKKLGLPESAYGYGRMSLKNLDDGVSGLQLRGMDSLAGDEEFWRDYLQSPQKNTVFDKWTKIYEKRERIAAAKREREIQEQLEAWRKERIKQALDEWDRKKEEEKLKKARELAQKRKKKKRVAKLIPPKTEDIKITETIRVATLWGDNYLLQIYPDGSQQLFRVDENGQAEPVRMWKKFHWVTSERNDGMLLLIPVIGRNRRLSPMDSTSNGARGPVGIEK